PDGRLITEPRPLLTEGVAALARLDLSAQAPDVAADIRQHAALSGRYVFDSVAVQRALAGESGLGQLPNPFGIPVLMSWQPLQLGQATYSLMSEQSLAENYVAVASMRSDIILGIVFAVLGMELPGAVTSWLLTRLAVNPLSRLSASILGIAAQRDMTERMPERGDDEIGSMSRALNRLFETFAGLIARIRSTSEQTAAAALQNLGISQQCRDVALAQRQALTELDAESTAPQQSIQEVARVVGESADQARQTDASEVG